ncbi:MAG TPA: discoidin domain-containing protein, partial [Bryobacteraceae bacterium]|nr:discoidin domain-containing protein [Bryobacteraceae bacterium]
MGYSPNGGWDEINGAVVKLSADVLTPTNRIPLESTDGFAVGDHIVLATSLTKEFIDEVGMSGVWEPFDSNIKGVMFSRTITNVEPGVITVDTPVRFYLKMRDDARAYHESQAIENSGIEDLSIGDVQHGGVGFGPADFNIPGTAAYDVHGSHFIDVNRARNVWIKNVSTYRPAQNTKNVHILSNAVRVRDASHVTLKNVHVSRPEYRGEGGNGYGFHIEGQETLLQDCSASYQRHGGTFGTMQCSGNVIHRCTLARSTASPFGGGGDFHRFLSQSNLIDNLTVDRDFFNARYRPSGTPTHGITATQSVFYNIKGIAYHPRRRYIVASAQAFQGYIIGTSGPAANAIIPRDPRSGDQDWLEGERRGATLRPVSLYASQLSKRNRILSVDQVTASSFEPGHAVENTMDNDLGTSWSAEAFGAWIMYDLGEDHVLSRIGIAIYKGDERIARVQVETSLDGMTWTSPVVLQASGTSNDTQEFDLPNGRARYVRITSLGNTQDNSAAITEVDIYGL